jgi:chromosome segregation ATPase
MKQSEIQLDQVRNKAQADMAKLESLLKIAKADSEEIQISKLAIEKEKSSKEVEVELLATKLAALKTRFDSDQKNSVELQKSLQSKICEKNTKIGELNETFQALGQKLDVSQKEAAQFALDNFQLAEKLKNLTSEQEILAAALSELQGRFDSLAKEKFQKTKALETGNAVLTENLLKKEAVIGQLSQKLSDLRLSSSELLNVTTAEYEARILNLTQTSVLALAARASEIDALKLESKDLSLKTQNLDKIRITQQSAISAQSLQLTTLTASAQSHSSSLHAKISSLNANLTSTSLTTSSLLTQITTLKSDLNTTETTINTLKNTVKNLENQLKDCQSQLKSNNEKIKTEKITNENLQSL